MAWREGNPRVAYIGGGWASNMGNAYYNLGAMAALGEVFGSDSVHMVPDVAAWAWKVSDNFELLPYLDVDLLLLSGPTLAHGIEGRYGRVFESLADRGGYIGFISAGAASYTTEERDEVAGFLARFSDRLAFLATRDSDTYGLYRDVLEAPVYDGICCSMFLDSAVSLPPVDLEPYVVFNFDESEPGVEVDAEGAVTIRPSSRRKSPQMTLNGLPVIRTRTRRYTWRSAQMFPVPGTFYWDIPEGFLTLYANAESVFSNRVHTCASTLVLGGKAMFVMTNERSKDNRRAIFDRLGLESIYERPTQLDFVRLERDRIALLEFLRSQRARLAG